MEFANTLVQLYGEKYGVEPSWFSTDERFNDQVDTYIRQKHDVKDIVKHFRPE